MCLIGSSFQFQSHGATNAVFEIDGVLKVIPLGEWLNMVPARQSFMRVSVSNHLWRIKESSKEGSQDYTEIGTDGTNVYSVRIMETAAKKFAQKAQLEGKSGPRNVGFAEVQPYTFPIFEAPPNKAILFLAYASASYLRSNSSSRLPPLRLAPVDEVEALKASSVCRLIFSQSELPLPARMSFVSDTLLWNKSIIPTTNVILESLNWTNIGTFSIPTVVNCLFFEPRLTDLKAKRLIPAMDAVMQFAFRVESVRTNLSSVSFPPEMHARSIVRDNRLLGSTNPMPAITFLAPRSNWPTESELRNSPQYKRNSVNNWDKIRKAQLEMPVNTTRPTILWRLLFALFLCITTGAFVFFLFKARSPQIGATSSRSLKQQTNIKQNE